MRHLATLFCSTLLHLLCYFIDAFSLRLCWGKCSTFTSAEILPLPPITWAAHKCASWLMIEWPNFPRLKGGTEHRGCLPSGWLFPSQLLLHYWIFSTSCMTHLQWNKWERCYRGHQTLSWDADPAAGLYVVAVFTHWCRFDVYLLACIPMSLHVLFDLLHLKILSPHDFKLALSALTHQFT